MLFSSGCWESYYARADVYGRLQQGRAVETDKVAIAVVRPDGRPSAIRFSSVLEDEPASENRVRLRTGNGLKSAAVAFAVIAATHLAGGIDELLTPADPHAFLDLDPVLGRVLVAVAAGLTGIAITLGVFGVFMRPAEVPTRPHVDAAAGVLRF